MTMLQVVDILVKEALKSIEPRQKANEANTTETPLGKTNADSPARTAVAEMLYVTEPVIEMFEAMISVYPDLKAECSLLVEQAQARFVEVARLWNLMPANELTEQPTETEAEQPQ
jgi:hypothetical protein